MLTEEEKNMDRKELSIKLHNEVLHIEAMKGISDFDRKEFIKSSSSVDTDTTFRKCPLSMFDKEEFVKIVDYILLTIDGCWILR